MSNVIDIEQFQLSRDLSESVRLVQMAKARAEYLDAAHAYLEAPNDLRSIAVSAARMATAAHALICLVEPEIEAALRRIRK